MTGSRREVCVRKPAVPAVAAKQHGRQRPVLRLAGKEMKLNGGICMERRTVAVILAAGQGKRMNSKIQKQYLLLKDKPVLYYSLKAFQDSMADEIILVAGAGDIEYVRSEIVEKYGFTKVSKIVEGGRERYHSVFQGLKAAVGKDRQRDRELSAADYKPEPEIVFIHDGARPFVDKDIICRTYECVIASKACVAAMPVKDTIKIADEEGFAVQTPRRSLVWMIQTPQVFDMQLIYKAYDRLIRSESTLLAAGEQITDDAWVVERFTDTRVKLVEGSYENIKITTPEDIMLGEALLKG